MHKMPDNKYALLLLLLLLAVTASVIIAVYGTNMIANTNTHKPLPGKSKSLEETGNETANNRSDTDDTDIPDAEVNEPETCNSTRRRRVTLPLEKPPFIQDSCLLPIELTIQEKPKSL